MTRHFFIVVAVSAALVVGLKVAARAVLSGGGTRSGAPTADSIPAGSGAPFLADLLARYPEEREWLEPLVHRYAHNAVRAEQADGLRGLRLLERLGLAALELYERPGALRRQIQFVGDDPVSLEILLAWHDYWQARRPVDSSTFALHESPPYEAASAFSPPYQGGEGGGSAGPQEIPWRDVDSLARLVSALATLSPSQRELVRANPGALPYLITSPARVERLVGRHGVEALAPLVYFDLSTPEHLQRGLETVERYGRLALDAWEAEGIEGFLLVHLYGDVLEALGDDFPLDEALDVLRAADPYLARALAERRPSAIAAVVRHARAAGLIEALAAHPTALRLLVEYGRDGARALARSGPAGAWLVYERYAGPAEQRAAVCALAADGLVALDTLDRYADDAAFHAVLAREGAGVVAPVARADAVCEAVRVLEAKEQRTWGEAITLELLRLAGEDGGAVIARIQRDGLARVAALSRDSTSFYEFLPLYDVVHLGDVLSRGYLPTTGEVVWASVDGAFVTVDAIAILSLLPEGVAAAEASRGGLRSAVRRAVEEASEQAAERAARRIAGAAGEAGARLEARELVAAVRTSGPRSVAAAHRSAAELADRAGVRLSRRNAALLTASAAAARPTAVAGRPIWRRAIKYVALESVQAGVGMIAVMRLREALGDGPE